ncbi:MAG: glycosyltransferase family 25 protein [Cyanobacteria bacterium J06639_14]
MKFIEFFDRTYIINLPSRSDRREEMEKELKNAGIPFTLGKVELFSAIRPKNPDPFKSIGYKGAFLSHLNVLKKAKSEGLTNVLIMEDDLELRQDFQQYEEIILGELLESAWDIVHFGYCSDRSRKYVSAPILQPFSEGIIGAQFYAVNGKSFDKLISFFELLLQRPVGHPNGGPMSPDGVFNVFKWQYPNIVRLIAVPSFGGQRSSRSDISPKWFDHLPILQHLTKLARSWGITKSCKSLLKSASYVFNRTE